MDFADLMLIVGLCLIGLGLGLISYCMLDYIYEECDK
jgi:hypothetical protein